MPALSTLEKPEIPVRNSLAEEYLTAYKEWWDKKTLSDALDAGLREVHRTLTTKALLSAKEKTPEYKEAVFKFKSARVATTAAKLKLHRAYCKLYGDEEPEEFLYRLLASDLSAGIHRISR